MGVTANEFPLLSAAGLYVKDTAGNGNCLFNALSDQLYGDQSKHAELRSSVIKHMRENAAYYKQFIEVHPGGGSRRNPKRKNAGGFSSLFTNAQPTSAEIDRTFEGHLKEMARGGTYGDNMEIVAFSTAFHVDVKIYQRDFAFVVSTKANGAVVPVAHIAYHSWEHYSSIRNVAGPHTGLPQVKSMAEYGPPVTCQGNSRIDAPYVQSWKVDAVMTSLPYLSPSEATVRKLIDECGGNVGDVVSKLLDDDDNSTIPSTQGSTQGSSSVERDLDSEDEDPIRGPNKRQDRRLSRATRMAIKENDDRSHDLTYRPKGRYLNTTEELSSTVKPGHSIESTAARESEEEEEEAWRNNLACKDSESASFSTSASDISVASKPRPQGVRLKLSQPKKDSARATAPSVHCSEQRAPGAKSSNGHNIKAQPRHQISPKQRRLVQRNKRNFRSAPKPDAPEPPKAIIAGQGSTPLMTTQGNERTPAIETHIKVLYI